MFRPARLAATAVALLAGAAVALPAQNRPTATKVVRPERPVWPDEGPRTWAPRPTVSAITANDLRTRLYQFADDSMQGRQVGRDGYVRVRIDGADVHVGGECVTCVEGAVML